MYVLSKKEVKRVLRQLDKQFGVGDLDYVFVRSEKGRIFIVNKDFNKLNLEGYNVNTIGLYIMKEEKDGIRLSIEGSQLIGSRAKKNVLVLDDYKGWLMGKNVDVDTKLKGYVIVKCGDDFVGCGKVIDGKLLNYIPKSRRILEVIS